MTLLCEGRGLVADPTADTAVSRSTGNEMPERRLHRPILSVLPAAMCPHVRVSPRISETSSGSNALPSGRSISWNQSLGSGEPCFEPQG